MFHGKYEALDDAEADRFVAEGIIEAKQFLGEALVPIRTVHLRLSTPLPAESGLPRGFRLCEVVSAEKGEFAIYLSRRPAEYAFAGQLAHEVAHLLNPWLRDDYVEGLNTLFAEGFLKKQGRDWSGWERHFRDGGDPFHGATYLMMKDVSAAAGAEHLKTVLRYATRAESAQPWMHIDMPGWIASLPLHRRGAVRAAMRAHADRICAATDPLRRGCRPA